MDRIAKILADRTMPACSRANSCHLPHQRRAVVTRRTKGETRDERPNRVDDGAPGALGALTLCCHSTVMPASLVTFVHLAIST